MRLALGTTAAFAIVASWRDNVQGFVIMPVYWLMVAYLPFGTLGHMANVVGTMLLATLLLPPMVTLILAALSVSEGLAYACMLGIIGLVQWQSLTTTHAPPSYVAIWLVLLFATLVGTFFVLYDDASAVGPLEYAALAWAPGEAFMAQMASFGTIAGVVAAATLIPPVRSARAELRHALVLTIRSLCAAAAELREIVQAEAAQAKTAPAEAAAHVEAVQWGQAYGHERIERVVARCSAAVADGARLSKLAEQLARHEPVRFVAPLVGGWRTGFGRAALLSSFASQSEWEALTGALAQQARSLRLAARMYAEMRRSEGLPSQGLPSVGLRSEGPYLIEVML